MDAASATLRPASLADATEITRLADELGYPVPAQHMTLRLERLLGDPDHQVIVAEGRDGLVGWAHVEHRRSVESPERAELMGLVVDPSMRRAGLGGRLVAAVERWAVARGIDSIAVRSNAARVMSHPFYEKAGYSRAKTQHFYVKPLPAGSGRAAPGNRPGVMTATDDQFLKAFESQAIPLEHWNHRAHLRLAVLYLQRFGYEKALRKMRSGIRAYNAAAGVEDSATSGYHETLTQAWLRVVWAILQEYGPPPTAEVFLDEHPELVEKMALRLFYSRERMMSPEARAGFVEPDLAPLPKPTKAGSAPGRRHR